MSKNNKLYKNILNDMKICSLCPHLCMLDKNEIGLCGARQNDGEEVKSLTYGLISAMVVDTVDKRPIMNSEINYKSLSIGSLGCSNFCRFCENFKISQNRGLGELDYFSPEKIVNIAKDKNCQAVSMTFNEPTISYEFLIDIAQECHKNDLKFILKTNGYINSKPFKNICSVVDHMNMDWKGSESTFSQITGCKTYITKERITEAYGALKEKLEISIPIYYIDEVLEEEIIKVGEFLSSIDTNIYCHILKINPSYRYDDFICTNEKMEKARKILSKYMKNIYIS
jgi:pyruvate formate lyase activating enzyme